MNITIANAPEWASRWTQLALAALPATVDASTPPPVIDEAISTLQDELSGIRFDSLFDFLHAALGEEKVPGEGRTAYDQRNNSRWPTSSPEVETTARALPADTRNQDYTSHYHYDLPTVGSILDKIDSLRAMAQALRDMLAPLNAQYAARRWTRVYLVNNSNGHVHSHMGCRNCYPTTQYKWITELSGASDEKVVEAAGERTCLTCYDSVREEIIAGRPCRVEHHADREEREAREAELEAKRQARIAKGVTPDGKPIEIRIDRVCYTIKTEKAAQLRYVDWTYEAHVAENRASHGTWGTEDMRAREAQDATDYRVGAEKMLAALAWKRNSTVEAQRELLAPKVTARLTRGY